MNGTDENSEEVIDLDSDEITEDLDDVAREAVRAVEAVRDAHRGEVESAEDELDLLRRELSEVQERATRTLADFENFRRRSAREAEEHRRFATSETLREFLDVMDNLERALSAGGSFEDLKLGVEMIHRQMEDLLRRSGVEVVAEEGVFDPALHEAVNRHEDPEIELPTVAEVMQKGYTLHGRLLRPARVVVAVPVEQLPDTEPEPGNEG